MQAVPATAPACLFVAWPQFSRRQMGGLKATDVRVLMLSRLKVELKWSVQGVS